MSAALHHLCSDLCLLSLCLILDKKQGFNWIEDSNMRLCACTTSSHITLNVAQFETRLCVFFLCLLSQNGAIALPLSQAELAYKALYCHKWHMQIIRCHVWSVQWDIRFPNVSMKTAKYHLLQHWDKEKSWALYCMLYYVLYIKEDILMLWGIVQQFALHFLPGEI